MQVKHWKWHNFKSAICQVLIPLTSAQKYNDLDSLRVFFTPAQHVPPNMDISTKCISFDTCPCG